MDLGNLCFGFQWKLPVFAAYSHLTVWNCCLHYIKSQKKCTHSGVLCKNPNFRSSVSKSSTFQWNEVNQTEKQSHQTMVEKLLFPWVFSPSVFLYELGTDQPKIRSEQEILEDSCVSQGSCRKSEFTSCPWPQGFAQLSHRISLVDQMLKNLPAMLETWVPSLGWEDSLKKGMATGFSILAWRISWTEEPGRPQPIRSQSWTQLSNFHFHAGQSYLQRCCRRVRE